jgi:hypothetical protein
VADGALHARSQRAPRADKEKNILMAPTLQQILLAPDTQPKVLADCHLLIDQEVSDKSGVSGPLSSSPTRQ